MVAAFFGTAFQGARPKAFSLRGKDACAQLEALRHIHSYSLMDFHGDVTANDEAVFAHFPYWERLASEHGPAMTPILAAIRDVWRKAFPAITLGVQPSTLMTAP